MTDIDLDKLEALADAALPLHTPRNGFTARSEFEAAVTPATIKYLIASAREAAAEIERLRGLLKPFAVYYEINDLDERLADDAIEVPVGDLRAVYSAVGARAVDGEG